MSVKLGLISDVHASPEPLRHALDIFKQQRVEHILCAGDIAGYGDELEETVDLLINSRCISIYGNHDLWYLEGTERSETRSAEYLASLPSIFQSTLEKLKLYMVHAHPPDAIMGGIKLLDESGELIAQRIIEWQDKLQLFSYDVLIVGHTHQVFSQRINSTLVINPGSTKFNYSCAILSLPDLTVEFFPLLNREVETVWNWGNYEVDKE